MDVRYVFLILLIPLIGVARSENEVENLEDSEAGEKELHDWPWGRRNRFVCPSRYGTFADISDCSSFYICVGGIANRKSCKRGAQFDKYRKICLPFLIVTCDKGDNNDKTTARPTTKKDGGETSKDTFSCPSFRSGNFPHPDDCSKYYSCTFYVSSLKTCPDSELFDTDKKECRAAKKVHCGSRKRPNGNDDPITTLPTTKKDEVTTKDKFTCPGLLGSGNFPHPDDCSKYYTCTFYISSLKTCQDSQLFDADKKECRPAKSVQCGLRKRPNGDDDPSTTLPTTKKDKDVTPKDKFTCPSMLGKFEHPTDCSKYYSCSVYISSLKTCPESELFDGVKKQCRPAKDVHCGTRQRPSEATTEEITTIPISTETPTAPEPETTTTPTEPETTTTPTEPETTTTPTKPETSTTPTEPESTTPTPTEPETTTPTEPEPTTTTTTEEPTTTKRPKVTAPDTECDEDDVDCIIDDLGETPDWFVCPEDIGSYPHPSSKKLFIFCLNWKPSVKKCGQDLVFSEDLMTCVHPY